MTTTQQIQALRKLQRETNDVSVKVELQVKINKLYDNMPMPKYSGNDDGDDNVQMAAW